MALLRIEDFAPDHRNTFGSEEVIGSDVYTEGTQEKIGTVDDILVDENTGEFRYLLVARTYALTGFTLCGGRLNDPKQGC